MNISVGFIINYTQTKCVFVTIVILSEKNHFWVIDISCWWLPNSIHGFCMGTFALNNYIEKFIYAATYVVLHVALILQETKIPKINIFSSLCRCFIHTRTKFAFFMHTYTLTDQHQFIFLVIFFLSCFLEGNLLRATDFVSFTF